MYVAAFNEVNKDLGACGTLALEPGVSLRGKGTDDCIWDVPINEKCKIIFHDYAILTTLNVEITCEDQNYCTSDLVSGDNSKLKKVDLAYVPTYMDDAVPDLNDLGADPSAYCYVA